MSLTVESAIQQVGDELKKQGKFSFGNTLDALIGVAGNNSSDLQAMLNKLLTKKGVLNAADEKELQDLLEKQKAEGKKRQQIRTKNVLIIVASVLVAFGAGYLILKNNKKVVSSK